MSKYRIIFTISLLFISTEVFSWTATYLGGGNWAIGCADGTNWSYSGSSAGLDIVGPALCPGGILGDTGPTIDAIEKLTAKSIESNQAGFPPKGYPCLGCEPCPGDPESFCSTTTVGPIGSGTVTWTLKNYGRFGRNFMIKRYGLKIKNPKPRTEPVPFSPAPKFRN